MSGAVTSRSLTLPELFLKDGVTCVNKTIVSKAATALWTKECKTHASRVEFDRRLGWTKAERREIKLLHPSLYCNEGCGCSETIKVTALGEKVAISAKKSFAKGELLAVYAGDVLTTTEALALGPDNRYLFTASEFDGEEQIVINAETRGNWTRYIGHSLRPNVEACVASGGLGPQVVIKVIRAIAENDAIVMNYGATYCEKFSVASEVVSPSEKTVKRKKEERALEMESPSVKRRSGRWNDPQFLLPAAYEAIAFSSDISERKKKLTTLVNEQRELSGCREMFEDEEVFRLFQSHSLDWHLRERRKELGWP